MSTESVMLRQERAGIIAQMRALTDGAEQAKRDLTGEENAKYVAMRDDANRLKLRYERMEELDGLQSEAQRSLGVVAGRETPGRAEQSQGGNAEYRSAFRNYLALGLDYITPEERALMRSNFGPLTGEQRALGAMQGITGGFTVPPEGMAALVDAKKAFGGLRKAPITYIQTNSGAELPIPTATDVTNKGRRIGENVAAAAATNPTFGQKILRAYIYTSDVIQVPFTLIQDSSIDIESWVMKKAGERLGRIYADEDTVGTGNNMPEGILTGAASSGITTASATAIDWAELVQLKHAVDPAYREMPGCGFMFHDSVLSALEQLKDGLGRPIFMPGINAGDPDRILDYPFWINQSMPSMAAAAKTVLFGDFSNFWVRDVRGAQVLRLTERYAEYGQVGFILFERHDALLADAGMNPVKYLTQHA